VHAGHGRLWTRVSAQVYNDEDDVARLGDAVERRA
jgi:selenocysteine lyase/cysteine desulfurase